MTSSFSCLPLGSFQCRLVVNITSWIRKLHHIPWFVVCGRGSRLLKNQGVFHGCCDSKRIEEFIHYGVIAPSVFKGRLEQEVEVWDRAWMCCGIIPYLVNDLKNHPSGPLNASVIENIIVGNKIKYRTKFRRACIFFWWFFSSNPNSLYHVILLAWIPANFVAFSFIDYRCSTRPWSA